MRNIYKLHNKIKNYEWGSTHLMPSFLGIKNLDKNADTPYAELWMGTHKGAPSKIEVNGTLTELAEISGELPFLLKILAIEKPLSIQAHPDKKQAQEGFKREEKAGIDINDYKRNYKDDNHKPEILCALSDFTLMAGFRETSEIIKSFKSLISSKPELNETLSILVQTLENDSLAVFFNKLFNLSKSDIKYIFSLLFSDKSSVLGESNEAIKNIQWQLMKKFASLYPDDPAVFSPLYLNVLVLKTGEAIYVPSGVLHAYISGLGVELMTASDNVLRGGLTPKYVDINELMNTLKFESFYPEVISSSPYFTPCNEFLLVKISSENDELYRLKGPSICIVTEGELLLNEFTFNKGESFYISEADEPLNFKGDYSLFAAVSCNDKT